MPNEEETRAIDIALASEATKAGIIDPCLIGLAKRDGIAVNGSTVYGAKESIESLKQLKPHIFDQSEQSTPSEEPPSTVKTESERKAERQAKIDALREQIRKKHGYDSREYRELHYRFVNNEPILEEDRIAMNEVRARYGFMSDQYRAFRNNGYIHEDDPTTTAPKREKPSTEQAPPPPGRLGETRADAFKPGSAKYQADRAKFLAGQ